MLKLHSIGSSPRVWGQAWLAPNVGINGRIIPTRVGTRQKVVLLVSALADHPHACGDKALIGSTLQKPLGSSPRVWGQGLSVASPAKEIGIIPTRVGTRIETKTEKSYEWDHPHACGDKLPFRQGRKCIRGSSPRVWGQAIG